MKTVMTLALAATMLAGCTQTDDAVRVLESAGYTDVTLEGYDLFNCSDDDFYKTKFRAKGPNGKPVSGVVCAGLLFKGATVRLN